MAAGRCRSSWRPTVRRSTAARTSPTRPRHGMPSFRQVLEGVSQAWTTQRGEVLAAGQRLVGALAEQARTQGPSRWPRSDDVRGIRGGGRRAPGRRFDTRNGSWGAAPKFPQPMTIELPAPTDRRRATGDRSRSCASRSTRWPTAASTTSWAAASIATPPTRTGSSRTSSRCSTTTRSSPGPTSTPGACSAPTAVVATSRSPARCSTTWSASSRPRTGPSRPARTRTPRASKG